MSLKLENLQLNEDRNTSSLQKFKKYRHILLYAVIVLLTLLIISIIYFSFAHLKPNTSTAEINSLKNQALILNDRVLQLEEALRTVENPANEQDRIKKLEDRISTLSQHIEALQNQPKVDISTQQAERSQLLEKDLNRLAEIQNVLKSYVLFLRLKTTILSDAPFRSEFNDFKGTVKDSDALSYLEKYVDHGLKMLKVSEIQDTTSSNAAQLSWWRRLRLMIGSFVKIEKVGEKSTTPTQLPERQTVENALELIEQTLLQKLTLTTTTSTPQAGDAL